VKIFLEPNAIAGERLEKDIVAKSTSGITHTGFAAKSAKPTNDNSPPIHRWVWDADKDVVRETDG